MAGTGSFVSDPITGPHLRLLHSGRTKIDPEWNWPQLRAPYWRFYTNEQEGAAAILGNQSVFPLKAGHLVVIPAWLSWSAQCRGTISHTYVEVDAIGIPRPAFRHVFTTPVDLGTALGAQLLALVTTHGTPEPAEHWRIQSLCAEIFATLYETLDEQQLESLQPTGVFPLRPALRYIDEMLNRPIVTQELADQLGVSTPTLGRLFRSRLGCSPGAYIRERRIAVASELLAHGDDSIDHIAHQVGFSDRQAFSKAFSAIMGCGPATHRRSRSSTG